MDDLGYMQEALELARAAAAGGDVPVGAVIVHEDRVIARAANRRERDQDPLAHAELLAIASAARELGSWRLAGCTLYVTLEPCAMCAGALVNARVRRLVFGTRDPKAGFAGSLGDLTRDARLNHRLEVTEGVAAEDCGRILAAFFAGLRARS